MRVRDIPDWPGNFSTNGPGPVPTHAEQVMIGELRFALEDSLSFKGTFDGKRDCICRIAIPDLGTSLKMAGILREHKGENLLAIADIELPAEVDLTPRPAL